MVTTLAEGPDTQQYVPSRELVLRVLREFDELPALRLTLAQAMRLWGLDRTACQAALDSLTDAHVLVRDGRGQYAKVHPE